MLKYHKFRVSRSFQKASPSCRCSSVVESTGHGKQTAYFSSFFAHIECAVDKSLREALKCLPSTPAS